MEENNLFKHLAGSLQKKFESEKSVLDFSSYCALIKENPRATLRGSAHYIADAIDYYGLDNAFRAPIAAKGVAGHTAVLKSIYAALRTFERQGLNNKLLLLHGPNGSAKSSIVKALMDAVEKYSLEEAGAVYSYTWVFPREQTLKASLGLNSGTKRVDPVASYAHLPADEIALKIPAAMRDHPLLLIPPAERANFLKELLGPEQFEITWRRLPQHLCMGDLNPRCKQMFSALLSSYEGNVLKVLQHIRIERFHFSKQYRAGLASIEPQLHVDARTDLIHYNKDWSGLPSALMALNFYEISGDLVDSQRGLIEYDDLLKRPLDSFKYLLIACEGGTLSVGALNLRLDTVFIGTCNEAQLDGFKEYPDYQSFKARFELIQVPYLLSVTDETAIYTNDIEQIKLQKEVSPHTADVLALWGILTRLKKPNPLSYTPGASTLLQHLTPLDKAKLLDRGEVPAALSPEDRKVLRSQIEKIKEEFNGTSFYEGRIGASARELKSILFSAVKLNDPSPLSPMTVLAEIEEFIKHPHDHEFLKQEIRDGFHDAQEMVNTVRHEYLNWIDSEVRDSMGLYDHGQWETFLKKYILAISQTIKKEKVKNPMTGAFEEPDQNLISEFETIVGAPTAEVELLHFRHSLLSQLGAWSLDHPKTAVDYAKVFPELWKKMERHYFETQRDLLVKMNQALLLYDDSPLEEAGQKLAKKTIAALVANYGYSERSAKETILYLMKARYT